MLRLIARDVATVEHHAAGVWGDGAGDHAEQRGLARAVRPDDSERLALLSARSTLFATTTAPKRLEIFSSVRIEDMGDANS